MLINKRKTNEVGSSSANAQRISWTKGKPEDEEVAELLEDASNNNRTSKLLLSFSSLSALEVPHPALKSIPNTNVIKQITDINFFS